MAQSGLNLLASTATSSTSPTPTKQSSESPQESPVDTLMALSPAGSKRSFLMDMETPESKRRDLAPLRNALKRLAEDIVASKFLELVTESQKNELREIVLDMGCEDAVAEEPLLPKVFAILGDSATTVALDEYTDHYTGIGDVGILIFQALKTDYTVSTLTIALSYLHLEVAQALIDHRGASLDQAMIELALDNDGDALSFCKTLTPTKEQIEAVMAALETSSLENKPSDYSESFVALASNFDICPEPHEPLFEADPILFEWLYDFCAQKLLDEKTILSHPLLTDARPFLDQIATDGYFFQPFFPRVSTIFSQFVQLCININDNSNHAGYYALRLRDLFDRVLQDKRICLADRELFYALLRNLSPVVFFRYEPRPQREVPWAELVSRFLEAVENGESDRVFLNATIGFAYISNYIERFDSLQAQKFADALEQQPLMAYLIAYCTEESPLFRVRDMNQSQYNRILSNTKKWIETKHPSLDADKWVDEHLSYH